MAEAAVLTTLGWVVSPLIKSQIEKALHYLGTSNERMKLLAATVLPRLSHVIEKAEESSNKEKLEDWLRRLKDAYYETEEAIDVIEYEELKQKVKDGRKTLRQKTTNGKGSKLGSPFQLVGPPLKFASSKLNYALSGFSRRKILLRGRIEKLVKIAEEANQFSDLLEAQENASCSDDPDRETISEPPASVFGREEDKDKVVNLLEEQSSNSESESNIYRPILPIIVIMGRSGVGKTTLAQYVYKHIEKRFDLSLWVHVTRKFKASDVIKDIIKIIKAGEGALHECNYDPSTPLQSLLTETEKMLRSKKFLLVLDDLWCDTPDFREQWEKFISCLGIWLPESRILLTTQSVNVALQVRIVHCTEVKTHNLQDLEEDKFFELLMHHAWPSACSMRRKMFEEIGRKIAAKLKGDPGAAKLLGRQLSEKLDLLHWELVAAEDWSGDNMKARIWSYRQLPADLQRCFTFCSLFPKGTWFPIPFLIDLWMAEGFTKLTHQEERMEDIGEKYLRELVSRFFLEQHANERHLIYLHDLFHDLAVRVRGDEFITIESTSFREIPSNTCRMFSLSENIRHISLPASMVTELKDKLCIMKNLYTLCVHDPNSIIPKKVLREILKNLEKLRLLYLPNCIDNLPDSIDNLKHLRLLYIGGSLSLKKLPDGICKLYHLQNLVLPSCETLPNNFCELISLRNFSTNMNTLPPASDVGRLTSLQNLNQFVVKKEPGHELYQLENLNQLRGEMCITGLENVDNIEDAVKADLQKKRHLEDLLFEFEWNPNKKVNVDFQLLESLQPHPHISRLKITRYRGNQLPSWLVQRYSLKHLTVLELVWCTEVEDILYIDEALPNCKFLTLWWPKKLKQLPSFPPNLTTLKLMGIPLLNFFSEDDLLLWHERKQSMISALKKIMDLLNVNSVEISKEVQLDFREYIAHFVRERLAIAPVKHKHMEIDRIHPCIDDGYLEKQILNAWVSCMRCHLETMFMNKAESSKLVLPSLLNSLWIGSCSITSDALSTCIESLVFLSHLKLSNIQTLTSLPPKEILCALKKLQSLTIEGCYMLHSLGGIGALTSLTDLRIERCLSLSSSNESLPTSLEKLRFAVCLNVDIIIAKSHLPALRYLAIVAAETMKIEKGLLRVGHLSSLEELTIIGWSGCLEGLNSLCSLHHLDVSPCPENYLASPVDKYTTPLKWIGVGNPLQLKLMLSDEIFSSIEILVFHNFQGDFSNEEVLHSLTSLKYLAFFHCNITRLLTTMKNIASLEYIYLYECQEDLDLSELEGLSENLQEMEIKNCPTLKEKFMESGPYKVRFEEESTIITFLIEEERKSIG